MDQPIVYEVWEAERPSYVSTIALCGIVGWTLVEVARAGVAVWPPQFVHVGLALWLGILFYWILKTVHPKMSYMSSRLTITSEKVITTTRYAISEEAFAEFPIAEIEAVHISESEPRHFAVKGERDFDMTPLPRGADIGAIKRALLKANPSIKFPKHNVI